MRNSTKTLTISCCALLGALCVGSRLGASVSERSDASPLAGKEFVAESLQSEPVTLRFDDLPPEVAGPASFELERLGVDADAALLEARSGRWRTLMPAIPLIPGGGVGNELAWEDLGHDAAPAPEEIGEIAWEQLRAYLESHAEDLGIDVGELVHRVAVHDRGAVIQVSAGRTAGGLEVRGASFGAVISQGNLVLAGFEAWGDVAVSAEPSLPADDALGRLAAFIAPLEIEGLREPSSLALVPARVAEPFDIGAGLEHRLVWVVRPRVAGDIGDWEGLVDAHTGELLALVDLNHYGHERAVEGGVYPASDDGIAPNGIMVSRYPMPFADLGTGGFTDAGGNFFGPGAVPATTTLNGRFLRVIDACGALTETSTANIDLGGTHGDTDCTVPPGRSPGDTAAARTTYYAANRIKEMARGQLPFNPWLFAQLTARTNQGVLCNAFWNPGTGQVSFFSSNPAQGCTNTGQVAGVVDHEWGHGMDDNDVVGTIPVVTQGGGEGMADVYAALRGDTSCIGRGFWANGMLCTGYGNPCTPASGCTGIRTVDWANRQLGTPTTLTWVRNNCSFISHCVGAAYSEAVWDLYTRDLPTFYGMSSNTALEVTTRLTYIGAGNSTGWFNLSGPPPGGAACGATQAYLQFLAADDDDGTLANGTPHMQAIAAAFNRHEIGCTPAFGGPIVQDSGCAGTPLTAPTVSVTATPFGAELSWNPVPGASWYQVYRTDGERQCSRGKTQVGFTFGTSFVDSGLKRGRNYYYVVIPIGAGNATCFGPASACATRSGSAYVMSKPFPGPAGNLTNFTASSATPGATTFFLLGSGPGSVPVPGCPGVTVNIGAGLTVLGSAVANPQGEAEISFNVGASASGVTALFQAVELSSCRVSNLVVHTF